MNHCSNIKVIAATLWRPLLSHFRMKSSNANHFNPSQLTARCKPVNFTFMTLIKRSYASESTKSSIPKKFRKPLLPFETESTGKDVLLFSYYGKERLCKAIGLVGIFLCFSCFNSAELIYRYLSQFKNTPVEEEYPWYYWWKSMNFESKYIRIGASGFLAVFGIIAFAFSLVYPAIMIREVTLLKGGEKIILQTYRPFGHLKSQELSLKDVSALAGPTQAKNYLPLKIRGKRLPLLLNQDGTYHNRILFDKTVALKRFK